MKCPVCRTLGLRGQPIEENLYGYGCDQCSGIWVSAPQYGQWLKSRNANEQSLLESMEVSLPLEETGKAKICPECGHLLRRYKVWPNVKFYLDRCASCYGVWFDQNEWTYLKARGEHDHIYEFFEQLWQEDLLEAEARERLEQLYLKRFGAEDYARIKEMRQWLWEHPQQGALLAYLSDKDPYRDSRR